MTSAGAVTSADAVNRWRTLPIEVAEPEALLAGGLSLLEGLATDPTPTLRWYRSLGTAIVLGRGQAPPPSAGASDVRLLTRGSGGGAVLLDPCMLSLDVALPSGHPLLDGDVATVFAHVGRAWVAGLGDLGITGLRIHEGPGTATRRGDARARLLAAVCYATVGRGEVLAGDRKLVGLAQRRRRPGALVQCGLLRRWQPGPLLAALGASTDDPEIEQAAIGLDDLTEDAPADAAIVAAVSARLRG